MSTAVQAPLSNSFFGATLADRDPEIANAVTLETEALLLEILSDYQVSIPELGTIEARQIPSSGIDTW